MGDLAYGASNPGGDIPVIRELGGLLFPPKNAPVTSGDIPVTSGDKLGGLLFLPKEARLAQWLSAVSAPSLSGARIPAVCSGYLCPLINEPILFQVDSSLIQYCQDFEPWKSLRTFGRLAC